MPDVTISRPLETRALAMALVQAVQMWSNPRYKTFLRAHPGEFDEEWFRWFRGAWGVGRTIKKERHELVRQYLDEKFRKEICSGGEARCVDAAVEHIQRHGWSSKNCKPISLVSKTAFFSAPGQIRAIR